MGVAADGTAVMENFEIAIFPPLPVCIDFDESLKIGPR